MAGEAAMEDGPFATDLAEARRLFEQALKANLAEVAAVIGETIGQEITYTDVPVEQLQQVLAGAGVPAPMDAVLADVDRGIAAGELLVPTTDLETLLGRPATDLRQAVTEALV